MSRFTWRIFATSAPIRVVSLSLAIILVAGTGYQSYSYYSQPTQKTQQVTVMNYNHEGRFSCSVHPKSETTYIPATGAGAVAPKIFMNLVESINLTFAYEFVADKTPDEVSSEVEVLAIVENPDVWKKEMIIFPKTTKTGNFTIDFPLEFQKVKDLIKTIEEEIGITGSSKDFSVVAKVNTNARFGSDIIDDEFVQTYKVSNWQGQTPDFGKELGLTKIGQNEGINYIHHGRFDYTVGLKPNTVYGIVTMRSVELTRPVRIAPPGFPISLHTLDWMDINYSYKFKSDKPVTDMSRQVEITASLQDKEQKEIESISLMPYTEKGDDFDITVPLDTRKFKTAIIPTGDAEAVVLVPQLVVKASVRVYFETGTRPVDETFTQVWTASLIGSSLAWDKEQALTKKSTIKENVETEYPQVSRMRTIYSALGAVFLLFLVYLLFNLAYMVFPKMKAGRGKLAQKVLKVEKKRKDIIVDVRELPEMNAGDIIIRVNSLDDLIKASDSFLKPVLRKLPSHDGDSYRYYVIDGANRYEYILPIE